MPTKHALNFLLRVLSLSLLSLALLSPQPTRALSHLPQKKLSTWHILIRQEIGNYGTSFCDSLLFERACDRETGVFEEGRR